MIQSDPIDRLTYAPVEYYEDALSILFVSHGRVPRINTVFGNERMVLIEVINNSIEACRTIKTALNIFQQYISDKLKSCDSVLETQPERVSEWAKSVSLLKGVNIRIAEDFSQLFTLQDKTLKDGQIALMLDSVLSKYEQQSKDFATNNAIELLSDSKLRIIEPWEQAGVCHACNNFEHVIATHAWREPKCSKCDRDNLTVRIYALDEDFAKHKHTNKDLPLFIARLINRKRNGAAVVSKDVTV